MPIHAKFFSPQTIKTAATTTTRHIDKTLIIQDYIKRYPILIIFFLCMPYYNYGHVHGGQGFIILNFIIIFIL